MDFRHENVGRFWDRSEVQELKREHKMSILLILRQLDGLGGNVSTIVTKFPRNPLQKITVRDHTLDVANAAINRAAGELKLSNLAMITDGLLVISALAHDISKMPEGQLDRRPGQYVKIMHARRSAVMIKEWLDGVLADLELVQVVRAVNHHHDNEETSDLLVKLKRADQDARELEMDEVGMTIRQADGAASFYMPKANSTILAQEDRVEITKGRVPNPQNEKVPFFNALQFLERLKPLINRQYVGKLPPAFSMPNEIIYFSPKSILDELAKWGNEQPAPWLSLELITNNPDRRSDLLAFVGSELQKIDAHCPHLMPTSAYFMREFVLSFKDGTKAKAFYIPVKARFFTDNIAWLENYKKGSLLSRLKHVEANQGIWAGKGPAE